MSENDLRAARPFSTVDRHGPDRDCEWAIERYGAASATDDPRPWHDGMTPHRRPDGSLCYDRAPEWAARPAVPALDAEPRDCEHVHCRERYAKIERLEGQLLALHPKEPTDVE